MKFITSVNGVPMEITMCTEWPVLLVNFVVASIGIWMSRIAFGSKRHCGVGIFTRKMKINLSLLLLLSNKKCLLSCIFTKLSTIIHIKTFIPLYNKKGGKIMKQQNRKENETISEYKTL